MSRRLVTAAAVAIVAMAVVGGVMVYVVEPQRRDVVAMTPDCRQRGEDGECMGSVVKYGPKRGYSIVVVVAGIAGALGFAITYRRGRSDDVPQARVSR